MTVAEQLCREQGLRRTYPKRLTTWLCARQPMPYWDRLLGKSAVQTRKESKPWQHLR